MSAIPRPFTILPSGRPGDGIFRGLNGQTITGNSSGAWAVTANGTNQNITLTPSGTTGFVSAVQSSGGKIAAFTGGAATDNYVQIVRSSGTLNFGLDGTGGYLYSDANNLRFRPAGTTTLTLTSTLNTLGVGTLLSGTSTLRFGATANATFGVSADTTAGVLQIAAPSAGSMTLAAGGNTGITISSAGNTTFGGNLTGAGSWTITGGAGNMTIVAGTGNSRTFTAQSTTSGGTATTFLVGDATQGVAIGGQSALATNATDGFVYIRGGAGTPTGAPTAITGLSALYVDQTNNKLYFYTNGAWRDAGP